MVERMIRSVIEYLARYLRWACMIWFFVFGMPDQIRYADATMPSFVVTITPYLLRVVVVLMIWAAWEDFTRDE